MKELHDGSQDKQPDAQSAEEEKSLVAPPRKNKRSSKKKHQDPSQKEQSIEEPSPVDDEIRESATLQTEAKLPILADAAATDDAQSADVEEPRMEPAAKDPALMEKVTQEFAPSEKSTPVPSRRKSKTSAPSADTVKTGSSVDGPRDSAEKRPSLVQADQKAAQVMEQTEGAVTKLIATRRKSKTVGPTTGLQDTGSVDSKRETDLPNESDKALCQANSESKDLELSPEQPNKVEVEDSVEVSEGQMPSASPDVQAETVTPATDVPASVPEPVSPLVRPADEQPEETTEELSETVASTAEENKILPPRRKSKSIETPLKEKEKAKLSPALRKTKTATKGAKEVSKNPERQKSIDDTEAAALKETKLVPTKRKTKNGNSGPAELESKNSKEPESGTAPVTAQEGTPTEVNTVKESPLLATSRKSKSTKAPPELSSKKDKETAKNPGKPSKPNETSAMEASKASPSSKKSKPSPETRKSSEKSKTTDGENGNISPPKRKLSVKPPSDVPTTEPAKSKDSPGSRKADSAKGRVKTTVETSVAEKGKLSPATRKSKGVKTFSATGQTKTNNNSKDQDPSLTSEVVTPAASSTEIDVETSKMSAAKSESEHLEVSPEVAATDLIKTEIELDEPMPASTSEVIDPKELANTADVTDSQHSSSAAEVIASTEDSDVPSTIQQTEDAVVEEAEVKPVSGEQSNEDIKTNTQESEGLKSIKPAETGRMQAEKERDAPKPPSTPKTTVIMTEGPPTEVPAEEHNLSQDQKPSMEKSEVLTDVPVEEEAKPGSSSEGQKPSTNLQSKEPENTMAVLHGQDQSSLPDVITVATDMNVEENEVPHTDITSKDQSPELILEKPSSIEEELSKTAGITDEERAKPTPSQSDGLEASSEPPPTQLVEAKEEVVGEKPRQVVTSEVAEESEELLLAAQKPETECAETKATPIGGEQKSDEVCLHVTNAGETATVGVSTETESAQSEIKESECRREDVPEHGIDQSVGEFIMTEQQSRLTTEPSDTQCLADYIDKICDSADQTPKRYLVLDLPQMGSVQTYEIKSAHPDEKTGAHIDSSQPFSTSPDRASAQEHTGSECEGGDSGKQERPENVKESHDIQYDPVEAEPEIRILQLDVQVSPEEENRAAAKNVDLIQTSIPTGSVSANKDMSAAEPKSEEDTCNITEEKESSNESQDSGTSEGDLAQLPAATKESRLDEEKTQMIEIILPDQDLNESQPGEFGSTEGQPEDARGKEEKGQEEHPAVIITVTQGEEPDREGVTEADVFPCTVTSEKTITIVQETSTGCHPLVPERDPAGLPSAASQPHETEAELIEINIYEDVAKDTEPPEIAAVEIPKVEEVTAKCESDMPESDPPIPAQSKGPQTVVEKVNLTNGEQLKTSPQLEEVKEQDATVPAPDLPDVPKTPSETEPVAESNIQLEASVSSVQTQSSITESKETKSTESLEEKEESARQEEQRETVVCLATENVEAAATAAPGEATLPSMKSPKVRHLISSYHLVRFRCVFL